MRRSVKTSAFQAKAFSSKDRISQRVTYGVLSHKDTLDFSLTEQNRHSALVSLTTWTHWPHKCCLGYIRQQCQEEGRGQRPGNLVSGLRQGMATANKRHMHVRNLRGGISQQERVFRFAITISPSFATAKKYLCSFSGAITP